VKFLLSYATFCAGNPTNTNMVGYQMIEKRNLVINALRETSNVDTLRSRY